MQLLLGTLWITCSWYLASSFWENTNYMGRRPISMSQPTALARVSTEPPDMWMKEPLRWLQPVLLSCCNSISSVQFVQSLSHVRLFATPWSAACQASLSITNSWSLLKLMSIESVMPSNHHILCHPLFLPPSNFPASGSFTMSRFFSSGSQSIGVLASASVLPMNIQDWFPLGLIVLISLMSKGLSRVLQL